MSARAAAPPVRRIVLCADDYGISPTVDVGIRDLIVRGRLNATSVLVLAPTFGPAEAKALAALDAGGTPVAIGLHIALTAPFVPATARFNPRANGSFLSLGATLLSACLHRFRHDLLVDEIAAQLRLFVDAFGRPPDFVDGHQHVQLFPQIRDALLRVVEEQAPTAWVRQCGRALPWRARLADRKGLLLDVLSRGFRRRAAALGVRTNPAFAGTYEFGADADFASKLPTFLTALPAGSVVMCHPGFVDAELERLDPLTTLREREHAYLAGDGFPAMLSAARVTLAGG
ncbi:MAG: ChbG/HpnK family deacetylase [Hyphomicrobiales bacterium]|nr:ChbG/HpnK family deacetylase [Hyphomicrobiales bacterium]